MHQAGLRAAHRRRYHDLQLELMTHLAWDADRLRRERTDALRRLVDHARQRSPFHAARLPDCQVDESDLSALPVMTKDDLMANFDEVVTNPRVRLADLDVHLDRLGPDGGYFLDRMVVVASGGSSGRRGVFVYDWDEWAIALAMSTRFDALESFATGLSRLLRLPESPGHQEDAGKASEFWVQITAADASHMTRAFAVTIAEDPGRRYLPATVPFPDMVRALEKMQPIGIFGYSSILVALARQTLAGNLTLSPAWVVGASEPLSREDARVVFDAWGLQCVSSYGMSEGLLVPWCSAGRCHLADDLVIVEPVDAHNRPVPAGTTSDKILITNLYNTLQPLIRYEVTDRFTLYPDPCPCGSALSSMRPVEGRTDDVFVYEGDVTVHPHVFRSVLGRHPAIVEYQVLQRERGATARLVTSSDLDTDVLASTIVRALDAVGLAQPSVDVELTSELTRQPTGKLRRFVPMSAVRPPADV